MKTFKQFLKEAKQLKEENSKYKPGEFGYWWTVNKGEDDIEGKVYKGNIGCIEKNLTSLRGCPKEVTGNFYCSYNELTSLEGAPEIVRGNIFTKNNPFTSLDGLPKSIFGNLNISNFNSLGGIDKLKELGIHLYGYIYSDGKKIKYDMK